MAGKKPSRKAAPQRDREPNIFIAWGGERSRHVANALYDWLPNVNSDIRPWMSTENLRSGATWFPDIMRAVSTVRAGIVCLTPTNLTNHWIHFEAGAIATRVVAETKVMTYLIGLESKDVVPPFSQFQHRRAVDREATFKLVHDLTWATGDTVEEGTLRNRFDKFWEELKDEIDAAQPDDDADAESDSSRGPEEMIPEILGLVRSLGSDVARSIQLSEEAILRSQGIVPPAYPIGPAGAQGSPGAAGTAAPGRFSAIAAAFDRERRLAEQETALFMARLAVNDSTPIPWSDEDLMWLLKNHDSLPGADRQRAEKVLHKHAGRLRLTTR